MLQKIINKIKWKIQSKRLAFIGVNSSIGVLFSIKGSKYIRIGNDFHAGKLLTIEAWDSYNGKNNTLAPQILIGDNVSMMDGCQLSAAKSIEIGEGCLFGPNVFVTDNFHGDNSFNQLITAPAKRDLYIKGNVTIGANVWIGRNVCVMPGVTIGNGAVIGANAVVTTDIPPFSVAVGVPAKVIKTKGDIYSESI